MNDRIDRETFAGILREISEAHGKDIAIGRVETYYRLLAHLPEPVLRAAADRAILECEFFPTARQLFQFSKQYLELSGVLLSAEQAFEATERAITAGYRPHMGEESIRYPNAACRAAVRAIGGYRRIAEMTKYNAERVRAEFVEKYDAVAMSAEVIGALVNGASDKRRYIPMNRYELTEGIMPDGSKRGPLMVWDTVERRTADPRLYELQEQILGARDEIAIGGNREGGGGDLGTGERLALDSGGVRESRDGASEAEGGRDRRGGF